MASQATDVGSTDPPIKVAIPEVQYTSAAPGQAAAVVGGRGTSVSRRTIIEWCARAGGRWWWTGDERLVDEPFRRQERDRKRGAAELGVWVETARIASTRCVSGSTLV